MSVVIGVSLLLIAFSLIYVYLKQRLKSKSNGLPGETPQILLGNLWNSGLLTNKQAFHEVLKKYQCQFGDKFLFWFGSEQCIVFSLPEHIQAIFFERQKFEQSPLFLPNFDLICPASTLVLTGARWKRHTRIMIPTFKRAKMIQHLDTIVNCIDRFIDKTIKHNQVHTNLVDQCQTLTMHVIGLIGFDYDLHNNYDKASRIPFREFVFHAWLIMFTGMLPQWMNRLFLKLNWKFQGHYNKIRQLTHKLVQQELNNRNSTDTDQKPKNLIASLVSALNEDANDAQTSSGLTSNEIFDEIITAIVAGFETTSSAVSWFIFFASKNPDVQQKIKDELKDNDLLVTEDVQYVPNLTPEKLDALEYCECVTKEVLRLAPIASGTTRIALCDTTINDVFVRQGQTVLLALQNANTDRRYWHYGDPQKFQPERFLYEDKNHHPYAFIPFGGGHRACLGRELAWLELKTIIVRLMQRGITFEDTPKNIGGFQDSVACFPKQMAVKILIKQDNTEILT